MSKQKKKGFTLIELLAVIVVLAIILVIAVPKILEVIENARLKAYEDSVNLMIKQAHLDYGSKNVTGSKTTYPVSYEYGIDSDGETIQTNEKEVGLLNFKGDKPSEGTIVVDELGKVTVQNLVSKDRKFCAIKGAGEKNATVGRATELNCIEDDNTPTPVPDIDPCELEIDKNDENIMYIDSVEDMYEFSDSVNSGNTYSGKTIKIRNDLDFKGYSEKKNVCGLSSTFEPIGNQSHPFSGKIDGNIKYIKNLTIDKPNSDNVGIFGSITDKASFVGLNLENITVNGRNNVGSLIGYSPTSGTLINEVVAKNINITGNQYVSGIVGCRGQVNNVIIKSGNVTGVSDVYTLSGYQGSTTNSIVENIDLTSSGASNFGPIARNYSNSYYSNKVTVNRTVQTNGFDSEYIDDLDYYTDKVETRLNGDKNNTGYYFDYVYSKGGIYLVNKYDKQESDDDTPSSQKNCKVTYGAEVKGCYRYTSGTHDGYKYRSPSSGELEFINSYFFISSSNLFFMRSGHFNLFTLSFNISASFSFKFTSPNSSFIKRIFSLNINSF